MLTGSWGIGKSFYIKNKLSPFLEKEGYQCIVVSLYGLTDLTEISKAIYFESRFKKYKCKSEAGVVKRIIAKTIIKNVVGNSGFSLNVDEKDLKALYSSIDLSNKLIVIEDVERSQIDIIDLLGYVNSLTEQDSVKVMLVANEDEIIQFEPQDKADQDKNTIPSSIDRIYDIETKDYTEKTKLYLKTKEKTISDTIRYVGDLKEAVEVIISSFENAQLSKFGTKADVTNIIGVMNSIRSVNLRSLIYACQKTADIYEKTPDGSFSDDFLRTVFYGNVAFSVRLNEDGNTEWKGMKLYSQELGIDSYPLFRFSYDYILNQQLDISLMQESAVTLERLRLYDERKSSGDQDLQSLYHWYFLKEDDVKKTVDNVTSRLHDTSDISFYEYAKIAATLIELKHLLGLDIDIAKDLLLKNLKGRGSSIHGEDLFWFVTYNGTKEGQEEFISFKQKMLDSLDEEKPFASGFYYLPEQIDSLHDYAIHSTGEIYEAHCFAKNINIKQFVEMLTGCTAKQLDTARGVFNTVYRPSNIKDFLADDLTSIEELINEMESAEDSAFVDRIQQIQYKWFIGALYSIRDKLI